MGRDRIRGGGVCTLASAFGLGKVAIGCTMPTV